MPATLVTESDSLPSSGSRPARTGRAAGGSRSDATTTPSEGQGWQRPHQRRGRHAAHPASQLRLALLNCGGQGLWDSADDICHFSAKDHTDILLLTETHMAAAAPITLRAHELVYAPRSTQPRPRRGFTGGPLHEDVPDQDHPSTPAPAYERGGVAVAVNTDTTVVQQVLVEHTCVWADALWVRVTLVGRQRPVFLCVAYIPPNASKSLCQCARPACPKVHVEVALADIRAKAIELGKVGDVVIAGDFNVQAEKAAPTPRWTAVQHSLRLTNGVEGGSLRCQNPRLSPGGALQPTRFSPDAVATDSVLDLIIDSPANAATLHEVRVRGRRPAPGKPPKFDIVRISDHYPITFTLVDDSPGAAAAQRLPPSVSRQYGLSDGAPKHLRSSTKLMEDVPPAAREEYNKCVVAALSTAFPAAGGPAPAVPGGPPLGAGHFASSDEAAAALEQALSEAIVASGLAKSEFDKVDTTAVDSLRAAKRLCVRLERQLAALPPTADPAPRAALQHQLGAIKAKLPSLKSGSRAVQRRLRRLKVARFAAALDRDFLRAQATGLARHRRSIAGQDTKFQFRNPRARVPTAIIQHKLYHLTAGIRQFYQKPGGAPDFTASRPSDAAIAAAGGPKPPDEEEVQLAMKQLKSSSVAIGLPVAAVRWIASDLGLASVTTVMRAVWTSGRVPHAWKVVKASLIYKNSGSMEDVASYRIIGVSPAVARLFQVIVNTRLHAHLAATLSPAQYGFLAHRATELALFLEQSAVGNALRKGQSVYSLFLDIRRAFNSTEYQHIFKALVERGVHPSLVRLLVDWFDGQRMFVQIGKLASPEFGVHVGVTEGCVFSPILFILVIDNALQRLTACTLPYVPHIGLQLGQASTWINSIFYADDGLLLAQSVEGMQALLDVCTAEFDRLGMAFQFARNKTACLFTRARKGPAPPPHWQLTLQGQPVPPSDTYKYLGMQKHSDGPAASRAAHLKRMGTTAAGVIAQACTAGLRSIPIIHATYVYRIYWKPRVQYELGLYNNTPPASFLKMESACLRMMLAAPNTPLVSLLSVAGIPTFQTMVDMDKMRILIRLLSTTANDPVRLALAGEVADFHHSDARARQCPFWPGVVHLLRCMDAHTTAEFRQAQELCPREPWEVWATQAARSPSATYEIDTRPFRHMYRLVLATMERSRRRQLIRSYPSLRFVADLVDSPNLPPFVIAPRTPATSARVAAFGGEAVLFDYRLRNVAECPWCRTPGGFTIPHLVRDCAQWEALRVATWERAKAMLHEGDQDLTGGFPVTERRQEWYRVTMGVSVPDTFIKLGLDTPSHFARPLGHRATRHLRLAARDSPYRRVLAHTGALLVKMVKDTEALLMAHPEQFACTAAADAPRGRLTPAAIRDAQPTPAFQPSTGIRELAPDAVAAPAAPAAQYHVAADSESGSSEY